MSFLEISPPALEFFSIFSASADDICSQKRVGVELAAVQRSFAIAHADAMPPFSLPTSRNALDAVLLFSSLLTSPCT
jgi:hypothetical protein